MGPDEAKVELIKALDLADPDDEDQPSWEDIVYYARKTKAMHQLANRAVARRTEAVYEATGTSRMQSWTGLLEYLREQRDSRT